MISRLYHLLNAAASRLAVRVADWSVRNASPPQREWLMAVRSELHAIDSGSTQLRWAVGGAWIVVSARADAPWVGAVGRNAISALLFWCCLAASQRFESRDGGLVESRMLILSACGAGLISAGWLRATFTAYFLVGQVAFGIAELAFHTGISIDVVQGAPAHFAVMIAATLAAVLAGTARTDTQHDPLGRPWNPWEIAARARHAVAAIGARSRLLSALFIVALAWAVPEVLARAQFGGSPFRDGLTDWAIGLGALTGYVLGAVTARMIRAPQPTTPEFACATAE